MKTLALAIALYASAIAVADARYFLFFCWHRHAPVYFRHAPPSEPDFRPSAFCKGVNKAYAKSKVDVETFIAAFPGGKQDQVRECIE